MTKQRRGGPGRRVAYALAYANAQSVGMANLGFQTVHRLLEKEPDASVRTYFHEPGKSGADKRIPAQADVVALSLSFEGDYPNAAELLARAGMEIGSARRGEGHPLVVAGGMAPSLNPEPLASIADVIYLGEAETALSGLHRFFAENLGAPRDALLKKLAAQALAGIYVPAAYVVEEKDEVTVRRPRWDAPATVELQIAPPGWEPAHTAQPAPGDAFGGAYLLEISRGCARACRFCAAGHLLGKPRFIALERLTPYIEEGAQLAGRLGFVGAAVSDHPEFKKIASLALEKGAGFTVSSFRAESVDEEALELMKRGGLKTLTIALEAGSQLLRKRIGKAITRENIVDAAKLAHRAGIKNLRIYGMIGLPWETDEDVLELARISVEAKKALIVGEVTLSVAPFVPKPFTPFQWEAMADERTLTSRLRLLAKTAEPLGVKVSGESPKWSRLQGLFARGGRSVGATLASNPTKSGWSALLKTPEAKAVLDRRRSIENPLPWDFIIGTPDAGALKATLARAQAVER